jgi:hypothetical protein
MKRSFHLSSTISRHSEQRHSQLSRSRRFVSLVAVCLALSLGTLVPKAAAALGQGAPRLAPQGPINVSGACSGQNAEVVEATASPYVYQAWIGCGGIGYARSTDSGATYSAAVEVPGSGGGWDPSLAVGPIGTVYVAFMLSSGGYSYPVVEASFDQGATFTQSTSLKPSTSGNYGDRDFIAVARDGTIYVTWDYGPDASNVKLVCSSGGSCAFSNGELNAVIQKSGDGGKTFGPRTRSGRAIR